MLEAFVDIVRFVFDNIVVLYVMDDVVSSGIQQLGFLIPFLIKYVDDLVLAVPENQQEYVLLVFNSYNPHIQFTIEI